MLWRRKITDKQLCYSASERCKCGAGLAYTRRMDYWECSDLLKNEPDAKTCEHSDQVPFSERFIKSEYQPSASGESTRPRTIEQIMKALKDFDERTKP